MVAGVVLFYTECVLGDTFAASFGVLLLLFIWHHDFLKILKSLLLMFFTCHVESNSFQVYIVLFVPVIFSLVHVPEAMVAVSQAILSEGIFSIIYEFVGRYFGVFDYIFLVWHFGVSVFDLLIHHLQDTSQLIFGLTHLIYLFALLLSDLEFDA